MAKRNIFLGNASGKVGDVVLRQRHGETIVSKYQPVVNNPKSPNQEAQRTFFGTVVKDAREQLISVFKSAGKYAVKLGSNKSLLNVAVKDVMRYVFDFQAGKPWTEGKPLTSGGITGNVFSAQSLAVGNYSFGSESDLLAGIDPDHSGNSGSGTVVILKKGTAKENPVIYSAPITFRLERYSDGVAGKQTGFIPTSLSLALNDWPFQFTLVVNDEEIPAVSPGTDNQLFVLDNSTFLIERW